MVFFMYQASYMYFMYAPPLLHKTVPVYIQCHICTIMGPSYVLWSLTPVHSYHMNAFYIYI